MNKTKFMFILILKFCLQQFYTKIIILRPPPLLISKVNLILLLILELNSFFYFFCYFSCKVHTLYIHISYSWEINYFKSRICNKNFNNSVIEEHPNPIWQFVYFKSIKFNFNKTLVLIFLFIHKTNIVYMYGVNIKIGVSDIFYYIKKISNIIRPF